MTIRIAHTSDLHIDERGRLDDVKAVLDAFLEQASEADVDLFVLAGDFFERRSTPTERNVLANFLQKASAIAPVFGVKGNHDSKDDLTIFNQLEADALVWIADLPTAAPGSAPIWNLGSADDGTSWKKVGLLALPWFDKAHLVAGLEATVDAEQTRLMTIAAAQQLLACLRAEASRIRNQGAVPILAAHIQVAGSEVASGQTLIGTSVELSPGDILDVDAAAAFLGHIHMSQEWFEGRVAYSGSPNRCNFGETETKGWRLVTLTDQGEFVSSELQELPVRSMVLLECDFTRGGPATERLRTISGGNLHGAIVRFRYRVRAEDLHTVDDAGIEAVLRDAGAHEVKLEAIVESETRVRSEAIAHVQSTAEKVDLYLVAKSIDVDEGGRTRLHSKLEQLEARP